MGVLGVFLGLLPLARAFRAVVLPGFGNAESDYLSFAAALDRRGVRASIVPIQRLEWLNIAKGVASPKFWSNECTPQELFRFYFERVDRTVRAAAAEAGEPVVLLCHSAGGWLARGMLGDGSWAGSDTRSADLVAGVVTLGSPHFPPEVGFDMARGSLKYVDDMYPGSPLVKDMLYVSVAGAVVRGDAAAARGSRERAAHNSYALLRGVDEPCEGDGLIPVDYALLDGSKQLVLQGVYHSIDAPDDQWYGGEAVVDRWLPAVRALKRSYDGAKRRTRALARIRGGIDRALGK